MVACEGRRFCVLVDASLLLLRPRRYDVDFFLESHWIKAHRLDEINDDADEPALLEVDRRCNDTGRTAALTADDANGDTAATPEKLSFSACNN